MKLLALAVCAGCDWSLHRMQDPVPCPLPDGRCELTPPEGAVPQAAPAEPPPITRALLVRGRDRFERFCAACHGVLADGDADVARVMVLRRPPSLIDAAATSLDDDRIETVMASGYGLMPSYSWVPARDREAILHYVRALQHSVVALDALSTDERKEAARWLR